MNTNDITKKRIALAQIEYDIAHSSILTPLYKLIAIVERRTLNSLEQKNKQLTQEEGNINYKYKYKDSDYKRILLLEKIENINYLKDSSYKQIRTIINDKFSAYIVKEKCYGVKVPTEQTDCQYDVAIDLLDKQDRIGYFTNKLSQEEYKEIKELQLKYETTNRILAGNSLLTFGEDHCNNIEGDIPIVDYMNTKCSDVADNTKRKLCESNFVDEFITNGEVSFTENGEFIIGNVRRLREQMGLGELIQDELIETFDNKMKEKTTQKEKKNDIVEVVKDNNITKVDEEVIVETQEPILFTMNKNNIEETTQTEEDTTLNKDSLEEVVETEESIEPQEQQSTPILQRTMMMRSSAPRTVVNNQLTASQQAQLKTISYINNNVDKVRYANNKRLNTNIQNTFKDNIVNDGKNAGNINDSMWYSINIDMSNDRDNLTKSSNGSTLINFGYNFNYIDNIDSSVAISFNQIKSDLRMYSKDIPVNTYDFALSVFNKYDFGNDIVLSGMLSYNHNIVKDRKTKNIKYDYVDENADYVISSFTKPTHKKHYNDLSLSLSVLHNYNILDNVKLTSGITADYFTTHKVNNALILSPMFEVGSVNGFYHNVLFPVVYVKYNANTNNKNIRVSDTRKVNLDKNNMEYGIKTKVGLSDKANVSFTYSGDSNRNNNIGANVGVEF